MSSAMALAIALSAMELAIATAAEHPAGLVTGWVIARGATEMGTKQGRMNSEARTDRLRNTGVSVFFVLDQLTQDGRTT